MATTTRDDVLARLDKAIAELASSARWIAWLRLQARLPRYSAGNCLLIQASRPTATHVMGYRAWQRVGRQVRGQERGIPILAPLVRRERRAEAAEHSDGTADAAEPVRRVSGWRITFVWDVEQTDGDDLPEVCTRLGGDDPEGAGAWLVAVAGEAGYRVEDAELSSGANGQCIPAEGLIRLQRGLAPAMRAKVLGHELAHSRLHHDGCAATPRPVAELEAESVAFILMATFGIDSGDYSIGYVATWAGGGDEARAALRCSAQRIQRTAAGLIDDVHRLVGQGVAA